MLLRNRIARGFAAGALVLAVPTLSACGMNYATDKVYTPAPGANDRDGDVDVLNAAIISTKDGEGTLIASFANNLNTDDALTGVSGAFQATLGAAKDYKIPGNSLLVLSNAPTAVDGIPVDGDFKLGDFVEVKIEFAKADVVTLKVPVLCNTNHFEGQDTNPNAGDELAEACTAPAPAESNGEAGH